MATRTVPKRKGPPKHAPRKTSRTKSKPRGFFRRFWWLWVTPLVLMLALFATLVFVYGRIELPDAPPGPRTTYLYDRTGKVITTLHAAEDRTPIEFAAMPQHLREAVIASEDKDFYEHKGVSAWGILRAAWADLRSRRIEQGGSTITQQYVKQVYTGGEKTILRKIKEGILALKLERKFSKDEILAQYLNTIYFGRGAYGVQAAAKVYFGKDAKALNLNEAATIAGVIPAPESYNPITEPDEAVRRRNLVLDRMEAEGYITAAEAQDTKALPIEVVARTKPQLVQHGADFVHFLRRELIRRYGVKDTFTGGLNVRSSMDLKMQQAAEAAVATYLPDKTYPSAALVAIDNASGQIRAMVGGRGTNSVDFNLATDGVGRQPGSAFKPFVLAVAMESGISPYSSWHGPSQIHIDDPACAGPDGPWEPSNAGDSGAGTQTLLGATALSVNTIYAQLVVDPQVRPAGVVELAHRVGIRNELEPVCGIALGSEEVHPLEMTNAYSTFAAQGVWREPTGIQEIHQSGVKVPVDREPKREAMLPNHANMVTHALEEVVRYGTGTAAAIDRPVAGKTGTTQDARDAWFCGYTRQLTTCVWVGYRKPKPMLGIGGYSTVYGGTIPARIWHDFMAAASEGMEVLDFTEPDFTDNDEGAFDPDPPDETTPPSPPPSPSPEPSATIPSPPPPPTDEPPSPTPGETTTPPPDGDGDGAAPP